MCLGWLNVDFPNHLPRCSLKSQLRNGVTQCPQSQTVVAVVTGPTAKTPSIYQPHHKTLIFPHFSRSFLLCKPRKDGGCGDGLSGLTSVPPLLCVFLSAVEFEPFFLWGEAHPSVCPCSEEWVVSKEAGSVCVCVCG